MRTNVTFAAEGLKRVVYGRIVKRYQRYVLLRCCRYTNSKTEAQRIASYTLITACSLTGELAHGSQLGWLIDSMVDVIAQDLVKQGAVAEQMEGAFASEMLLADGDMQTLASRMNGLDALLRQVLVLRHIERMSAKMISRVYRKSIAEIMLVIDRAERELAEDLCGAGADDSAAWTEAVPAWVGKLGEALDLESRQHMQGLVLRCLAQWQTPDRASWTRMGRWSRN
jgi:DNA-directed RNA polymerase specialized sigma24 family protein